MTNQSEAKQEIKIKTPYGVKNWGYIKKLMDEDVKNQDLKTINTELVEELKSCNTLFEIVNREYGSPRITEQINRIKKALAKAGG